LALMISLNSAEIISVSKSRWERKADKPRSATEKFL
jgi:hypothetical protein